MARWLDLIRLRRILKGQRSDRPDESLQKILLRAAALSGRVVEIGPGSGNLLCKLLSSIEYIGVEPNKEFHQALKNILKDRGMRGEIIATGAESLPIESDSCDAVISLRALCEMRDLPRALSEIKRVLKKGGLFIFCEHVAAPRWSWRWFLQICTRPLFLIMSGCNPAQEIEPAIRAAGFEEVEVVHFKIGGRRNIATRLRIYGAVIK